MQVRHTLIAAALGAALAASGPAFAQATTGGAGTGDAAKGSAAPGGTGNSGTTAAPYGSPIQSPGTAPGGTSAERPNATAQPKQDKSMSMRDRSRYSARNQWRQNEPGSRTSDASVPGANRGQGNQSTQ